MNKFRRLLGVNFGKLGYKYMLRSKSFVRVTGKGNVVKVVREHYLRDDLPCGLSSCTVCPNNSVGILLSSESTILIPDTNIILHYLDVLEHPSFTDIVILQTVLEEVKNRNTALGNRLRNMASAGKPSKRFFIFSNEHHKGAAASERLSNESDNDRNDRAIRTAVKWYSLHTLTNKVVLLTNDQDNKERAKAEGILAYIFV